MTFEFYLQPGQSTQPDMCVTYLCRINKKAAEADARQRFEDWLKLQSPWAKRKNRIQIVAS